MAVRIVGVDLPQNKRGEIALTYIFGIGRSSANKILQQLALTRISRCRIGPTLRQQPCVRLSEQATK